MKRATLSNIASISTGLAYRGAEADLAVGDAYYVSFREVAEDAPVDWESCLRITPPTKREPDWLRDGDILMPSRGAKPFAALVSQPPEHVCASGPFLIIRPEQSAVSPRYLTWYLNRPAAQARLLRGAEGSAIKRVSAKMLGSVEIPLPPLARQHVFADIAANNLAQRRNLTEQLANSYQHDAALARALEQGTLA